MLVDLACVLALFIVGSLAALKRWGRLGVAVFGLMLHRLRQGGTLLGGHLRVSATRWFALPIFLFVAMLVIDWVFLLYRPTSNTFGMLATQILIQGVP